MGEEKIEKLVAVVREQLQSDENNLNAAVDFAIDFSKQNSIAPETLLKQSSLFISNGTYTSAYVFAKTAADLSEEEKRAAACYNAGVALSYIGRCEEAEKHYKMALAIDSNDEDIHYNYGNLLSEMGRNEEAEEQYKNDNIP